MKIVQLTPGAGENFYCENCLRDAAGLRALRAAGVDALAVPLYLPPPAQLAPDSADERVFFGGINVYLQQTLAVFRHTPRWLDRLLDAHWLLRWAGRKTSMTDARILGETTLSMLRGARGRQVKELDRLAGHLAKERPDVILLSNALLIGLARRVIDVTGAAVVCWLQDEEGFLDTLPEPWRTDCWAELRSRAEDAAFIAPSHWYARRMAGRLGLPVESIAIIRQGVDVPTEAPAPADGPPTVGFLSQLAEVKGLDLLVEAVAELRSRHGLADLRLVAVGGRTQADKPFLETLRRHIARLDLTEGVTLATDFTTDAKADMLARADVLAVPCRRPEAYGLHLLEAMAAGRPVVAPDHGGQAELVAATGGGLTHTAGGVDDLARAIAEVLTDPARCDGLAAAGRDAVARQFNLDTAANQLLAACRAATGDDT
ncbi:MAG: glycosyltransferase [Planctomycetes bacterium]|jgi:glycosyltransferase involved in cell wall biosynthesis|nr:glycosyltransferase family 4 protein [Phycisphaerae bacterium]NBB96256.1 glycosyltransferase [Planctomycetota bacterium]